jgi:hypothetical protein
MTSVPLTTAIARDLSRQRRRCPAQSSGHPLAGLAHCYPSRNLLSLTHGQLALGSTWRSGTVPTGLRDEGPDGRPATIQPAPDRPKRLPATPPSPDVSLLGCGQPPVPHLHPRL